MEDRSMEQILMEEMLMVPDLMGRRVYRKSLWKSETDYITILRPSVRKKDV